MFRRFRTDICLNNIHRRNAQIGINVLAGIGWASSLTLTLLLAYIGDTLPYTFLLTVTSLSVYPWG
ncbi:hypothetical protein GQ53DRAFT_846277 [Thozetella sp. PMI_491]|nr:hypothetical protein GQ53DRAFT_846277 [Thozetella sp. PMI_491]